jgi:signal transduction histidine kinase
MMDGDDTQRSRASLIDEVTRLRRQVEQLQEKVTEQRRLERKQQKLTKELAERVKELDCLYNISRLLENRRPSWESTLQEIVDLLPSAWQHPEYTCVRLLVSGTAIESKNFRKTPWGQFCNLHADGKELGQLEVYSFKTELKENEKRFLEEEQKILNVIGERLSTLVQQHHEQVEGRLQQERFIQLDKMVALGVLVSGVAHEINNPNNFIMLNTPLLEDAWRSIAPILDHYCEENGDFLIGGLQFSEFRDDVPRLFAGIKEGSQRIKSIVDGLKRFSRVDSSEMTHGIDLNAVTRSAVALINNHIRKSTDRFFCSYAPEMPPVRGHYQRLEQVVINLLHNACDALPDKNSSISVTTSYDRYRHRVLVEIRDEGIGIPADKLSNIQDPFYTTKRDRGGTGLGLSVSSGIMKAHNGYIHFDSTPGKGTTATVVLPVPEGDYDAGEDE